VEEVRAAVESGKVPVGIVQGSWLKQRSNGLRIAAEFDPYPDLPKKYMGAVARTSRRPIEARRLWNHLHRELGASTFLIAE